MSGLANEIPFTWAKSSLGQSHATVHHSKEPYRYIPFVSTNIEIGMNLNEVDVALRIEFKKENLGVHVDA